MEGNVLAYSKDRKEVLAVMVKSTIKDVDEGYNAGLTFAFP